MLKAIVFDMDGVLVDSLEANTEFYKLVVAAAGYPTPDDAAVHELFHLPLKATLGILTGVEDPEELERMFALAQSRRFDTDELLKFPEKLVEVLEELHQRYQLGIVTSRIKIGIEEVFSRTEIKHLFDVVVSYEDSKNHKPHPEPLLLALTKLGLGPEEAIYVGDSMTDIDAARDAGMRSIHLTTQPHPDATAATQEFHELLGVIEQF